MANDPVLNDQHLLEGDAGQHDIVILEQHQAPSTDEGVAAFDPWKEFDIWRAKKVMEVLNAHYPGHLWGVISDHAKGIVRINIPVLMGVTDWFVINLRTHDLTPGMIFVAGGEILERYGLTRGRMNVGQFLDAREKHSKLLVPSRKVPD